MKDKEQVTNLDFLKKMIHPIVLRIISAQDKRYHHILGTFPRKGNYLIVANSMGKDDIRTLMQTIKRHFYLAVDIENKENFDNILYRLNGIEWLERKDGNDEIINNHLCQILRKKKNLAMFPEGTYNCSCNQLILPINDECIRVSLREKVPIIPVVSWFGREIFTIIGDAFYPTEDIDDSINRLRNIMASLYFEAMNKYYENIHGLSPRVFLKRYEDDYWYYYEKRDNLKEHFLDDYVKVLKEYPKELIFTSKDDAHLFFQEFNSIITYNDDGTIKEVRRISSEKDGYEGPNFGEEDLKDSFGYGYNDYVLKKHLRR